MRARISRWFLRVGRRLAKPAEWAAGLTDDLSFRQVFADQTKATQQVTSAIRDQTHAAETWREQRQFENDHERLAAMEGDTMPSEGLPLRIVSDGMGMNTQLMIGDVAVTNALRVTWSASGAGVARCLVEFDAVQVDVAGEIAGA